MREHRSLPYSTLISTILLYPYSTTYPSCLILLYMHICISDILLYLLALYNHAYSYDLDRYYLYIIIGGLTCKKHANIAN